jgi:hypothetical protein
MRLHTLWTCILDTPWTPAIFYIDFPMHFRSIFDYFNILWFILNSQCTSDIACWSHSHCGLLPITSHIFWHTSSLFHPFLPSAYHNWRLRYFHLYHMAIDYYCDALLKQWSLHSSHDIPTHFSIFIICFHIFSPFYIYLTLPYPHKKNRREICSPHHLGTPQLCFHCDCILHPVLQLLAINLWPFSIAFL